MTQTAKKIPQSKVEAVAKLKEHFLATPDLIFSDFRGLTFPQMTELRDKLGETQTAYRVVRNSQVRIAMQELGFPDASGMLTGPTALAFLGKDPGPVAKIMIDFGRSAPLAIKGGVIGGRLFSLPEVEALSRLPSRAQLLSKLLATMNAPLMSLMYVMKGVSSKLVRTLAAVAEKKRESEGATGRTAAG